jgi:hypothetical protein
MISALPLLGREYNLDVIVHLLGRLDVDRGGGRRQSSAILLWTDDIQDVLDFRVKRHFGE